MSDDKGDIKDSKSQVVVPYPSGAPKPAFFNRWRSLFSEGQGHGDCSQAFLGSY